VYESSKVRMKIAPSFWSAIYTIPTVLVLQTLITDHCAEISHRKHTNLSRSIEEQNEGQLPALERAAVSVNGEVQKARARGSVCIVCTALHSQEAMRSCPIIMGKDPILMGSSETDHSSYREVQIEACPKEKH